MAHALEQGSSSPCRGAGTVRPKLLHDNSQAQSGQQEEGPAQARSPDTGQMKEPLTTGTVSPLFSSSLAPHFCFVP